MAGDEDAGLFVEQVCDSTFDVREGEMSGVAFLGDKAWGVENLNCDLEEVLVAMNGQRVAFISTEIGEGLFEIGNSALKAAGGDAWVKFAQTACDGEGGIKTYEEGNRESRTNGGGEGVLDQRMEVLFLGHESGRVGS